MRNTKQKNLVLEIINNSYNHLSTNEVYNVCRNTIPNISLGTVYRNLNYLVENNLIKRIKMNDNIDRYDKLDDHIHFICMRCNKIFDIYDYSLKINEDLKGKKVLNPKIILEGICEKCQKKEEI